MKIEVFYRDVQYSSGYTEKGKGRPEWFDRASVYENFRSTADPKIISFNYVFDSPNNDMVFTKPGYHHIKAGTDQGAFYELMKILKDAKFDPETIIYIVENDYLHRHGWCDALLEGFEHGDYITLYDHLDKYLDYPDLRSKVFVTKSCHWRTTPSTTNTFAVKYGTLMEDADLHLYYAEFGIQGFAHDHTKFLDLGNKGRTIISSIPGYSTHCNNYLSPTIDWEKTIKI